MTNPVFANVNLPTTAGEQLHHLPFSLRVLLENALQHRQTDPDADRAVTTILGGSELDSRRPAIPFYPTRVLLQDLTGVPLVVDLAAMRDAAAEMGIDPAIVAPRVPVDLVIDHSLQVDFTGLPDAMARNQALEYSRNRERYELLRWAQNAFANFRVVPPGKGIVHQINLEVLATVVTDCPGDSGKSLCLDSVVGTDSHTPMINGLGVLGWGVGGIEAIAVMLGKPLSLLLPEVIGLELVGKLSSSATATDLALTIVERLRQEGVVGSFVECFGAALPNLPVADRAMIANMSPESGATVTYFPVDGQTLTYLRLTGRSEAHIRQVENYCRQQGLFRDEQSPLPEFSRQLKIDLSRIKPSLAGPRRPQDRITLPDLKTKFNAHLIKNIAPSPVSDQGIKRAESVTFRLNDQDITLSHGSLVIAAITSCTNTSNPDVMISAGLVAQKALARGLMPSPAVKCSLMPGSRVVTSYLQEAGLLAPLIELGFDLAGYGCGSCIGNSGPLKPEIVRALQNTQIITASISSGNRNFEGRIHPLSRANYLASPPLVVAYALAGTVDIDLTRDPLGVDPGGKPIYLQDLLPDDDELAEALAIIQPDLYQQNAQDLFTGDPVWQSIYGGDASVLFDWNPSSTYIQRPPYFQKLISDPQPHPLATIYAARALAVLGDSITTDHISPAGQIPPDSPAGHYLQSMGIRPADFNSYGARRGNDQVMTRGTFANIRLRNKLTPDVEGGFTRHFPDGAILTIHDAACAYRQEDVPLIILAGAEYGTGSSRDWAAKGPLLLGVRAVIAQSFERIHRANLVGMGILPLVFLPGEGVEQLGLTGEETFSIRYPGEQIIGGVCQVEAKRSDGEVTLFEATICIDSPEALKSLRAGGILHEALLAYRREAGQ